MARKLFYENAYDATCTAKVVAVDGNAVILDQTVFYGESGGQPGDTGTLNGVKVISTKAREDGEVLHLVEDPSKFAVGSEVSGSLDWERRLRLMRTHTSLHLVAQVAETIAGKCQCTGSGMKDSGEGHVDLMAAEKRIAGELVPLLEAKCNEVIRKGAEVKAFFDEQRKDYRFIQIDSLPPIPCGGTHVRNVSEIGAIKLKRENVGKGKDRVIVTLSS